MLLGRPIPRTDSNAKVTGAAIYSGDIVLPDMIYAKILRSPYAHAEIVDIDTADVERIQGVRAVLTFRNAPQIYYNAHVPPPVAPQDQMVLSRRVRFVGEPVAAVAADDHETAEQALEAIQVKYRVLEAVFDPEESLSPTAPKLHENSQQRYIYDPSRNLAWYKKIEYGDVEKAFKAAYYVRGPDRYKTHPVHTSPLELPSCVADYDCLGRLTFWAPTQFPLLKRYWLSKILNLPITKVRVKVPYVGGAFGSKTELLRHEAICALLARTAMKPVKIHLTREELLAAEGGRRHSSIIDLKLGVDRKGRFLGLEAKVVSSAGAYCPHGVGVTHNMINQFHSLYRFPNYRAEGYCVYVNMSWAGAFRGYGFSEPTFALESSLDMLAKDLKMNPIELRLKNHVRKGDTVPWSKTVIRTCGLGDCLKMGMRAIGWKKRKKSRQTANYTTRIGVGMSCITHHTSLGAGKSVLAPVVPVRGRPVAREAANAIVRANEDGTFTLLVNCPELGSGQHTALMQMAAEALGVEVERIVLDYIMDTDIVPYDLGPAIDRTVFVTGGAVKKAAEETRRQLLKAASKVLNINVKDLAIAKGKVYSKSRPDNQIELSDLVRVAQSNLEVIMGKAHYTPRSNAPSFGAEFAEVEVDTETGSVKVVKVVGVFDVGRVINRLLCEGQVQGGIVQGIGATLTEGLVTDLSSGVTLNPNFADYKLPSSTDVPKIELGFVETKEPYGPFGAKGMGQIPIDGIAAALANAIYDAIGVRITELPMTAEKILDSIKAAKGSR